MGKQKIKNVQGFAVVAVVIVVLIAVVGGYILVNSGNKPDSNTENTAPIQETTPSPTQSISEYSVDTVNDGVYINYENGFKFDYPEEIFTNYELSNPPGQKLIVKMSNAEARFELGSIYLLVYVNDIEKDSEFPVVQKYQDVKDLPAGVFEYSESNLKDLEEQGINPIGNIKKSEI
jgi:hypothetical protein